MVERKWTGRAGRAWTVESKRPSVHCLPEPHCFAQGQGGLGREDTSPDEVARPTGGVSHNRHCGCSCNVVGKGTAKRQAEQLVFQITVFTSFSFSQLWSFLPSKEAGKEL